MRTKLSQILPGKIAELGMNVSEFSKLCFGPADKPNSAGYLGPKYQLNKIIQRGSRVADKYMPALAKELGMTLQEAQKLNSLPGGRRKLPTGNDPNRQRASSAPVEQPAADRLQPEEPAPATGGSAVVKNVTHVELPTLLASLLASLLRAGLKVEPERTFEGRYDLKIKC